MNATLNPTPKGTLQSMKTKLLKTSKSHNISLFAGLFILLLLTVAAVYPALFTQKDPYATQTVITDSTGTIRAAPFPPGMMGIFGSDELGRDLYTQVVYGTRMTLQTVLLAVLLTLAFSFLPGLAGGFGRNPCSWLLKVLNTTFSTVPAIIFCMILLKMPLITSQPVERALFAYALVIAFVETGRMGSFIQHRVEEILKEPFVEGAVVIGKSPLQIAFQNVLPHLLPGLVVYLSLEVARILFIMCQLAVFNIVAGNIVYDSDTTSMMGRFLPYEPEWSGLLGTSIRRILTNTFVVIPPLSAFFLSILGFNLLGEGLRTEFEKKNSHFITFTGKIIYLLSPKAFLFDFRRMVRHPLRGLVRIGVLAILLLLVGFPRYLLYNDFHAANVVSAIRQIQQGDILKQGSYADTRNVFAEYITGSLKASGLTPAGSDGYLYEHEMWHIPYFSSRSISLQLAGKKPETLNPDSDYSISTFVDCSVSAPLTENPEDAVGKILIIEENHGNYTEILNQLGSIDQQKRCEAIVLIRPDGLVKGRLVQGLRPLYPIYLPYLMKNVPVIEVNGRVGERLRNNKDAILTVKLDAELRNYNVGKNIFASLPGSDKTMDDQYIVIGTGYDFNDFDPKYGKNRGLDQISPVALNLELARALAQKGTPKKTVLFAFWDTHGIPESGAQEILNAKGIESIWNSLYIDLKSLYPAGDDNILIDLNSNSPGMLDNQRMIKYIQNDLAHMGVSIRNRSVGSVEADIALVQGFGSIILESPDPRNGLTDSAYNPDERSIQPDAVKLKKIGQALFNAIVQAAY